MKKILRYLAIAIMLALLTFIIINDVWSKDFKDKPDKPIKPIKITNNTFITKNTIDNKRLNKLEDTAYCVKGEVQFIRKKDYKVGVYGKYNIRHHEIAEVGIKITVGLGQSWEQKKIEKIEKRIKSLEQKLGYIGIEPTVEKMENGWKISISEKDTPKMLKRF